MQAFVAVQPRLDIPSQSLSDADRAVGELAGEGRRLPDPHLLIRPFLRKEAVFSIRSRGRRPPWGSFSPRRQVAVRPDLP